jgi:CMP/dCMP kinase
MSARLPVVTLDGPAGVGKTTLARRVAEGLGLSYLDTGAMFRCMALKLGANAENMPEEQLRTRCAEWTFTLSGIGQQSTLFCNGMAVRGEVRTEEVGMLAARIATVPVVREILRATQRAIGEQSPLVAEGRDMGTVVFPDARFKFFLDAAPEVRALRRLHDLENRGQQADLATLTDQIRQRDALDRNRAVAPLRPAQDALIVDTSHLDIEGVLGALLHHINVHGGAASLRAACNADTAPTC